MKINAKDENLYRSSPFKHLKKSSSFTKNITHQGVGLYTADILELGGRGGLAAAGEVVWSSHRAPLALGKTQHAAKNKDRV
jgi:hypothetical protein